MNPLVSVLGGILPDVVKDVVRRVLPREKLSEEDLRKIELEAERQAHELWLQKYSLEVQDRISARRLAERELRRGSAFTNFLAAIHRPIWSLVTLGVFVFSIVAPSFGWKVELTDVHKSIIMTVIIFYFGGRSTEKILGKAMH